MKNITFFTPNSFTLNGDEYNELFNVITVDEIQDYKIQILTDLGKEPFILTTFTRYGMAHLKVILLSKEYIHGRYNIPVKTNYKVVLEFLP